MHTILDTFSRYPSMVRRKRGACIGASFGSCLRLFFTPIVYFHVSEAHAEQEPSTVAPEDEYPVPSYLEGLSQSKDGLRHLDACRFHTVCVTVKHTHSSPVLFTEIRISPVHWHDNGGQGANSCLRYRLNPGNFCVRPTGQIEPIIPSGEFAFVLFLTYVRSKLL